MTTPQTKNRHLIHASTCYESRGHKLSKALGPLSRATRQRTVGQETCALRFDSWREQEEVKKQYEYQRYIKIFKHHLPCCHQSSATAPSSFIKHQFQGVSTTHPASVRLRPHVWCLRLAGIPKISSPRPEVSMTNKCWLQFLFPNPSVSGFFSTAYFTTM